jgi:hypothetical protein
LPELQPEEYELRLLCRNFTRKDKEIVQDWHNLSSIQTGSLKFTVHPEGAPEKPPAMLPEKDVRPGDLPAEAKNRFWQLSVPNYFTLDRQRGERDLPAPGLRVGAFDLEKYRKSKAVDFPQLRAPDEAIYVTLLGPVQDLRTRRVLREVYRQDREVVLLMDVWRETRPFVDIGKRWQSGTAQRILRQFSGEFAPKDDCRTVCR